MITVGRDEYSINFAHSLTWEVDEDDVVMLTQSIAGSGKSGSRSRAKTFNAEVTGNFPGNWLSISSGRGVDAYTRLFSTFAMEDQNSFLEAAGDAEVPDIYLPSDGGYGLALQFWVTDEQILFNTFIDFMDTSLNALTPISSGEEDDCQEEGWIGVNVAVRNEFWVTTMLQRRLSIRKIGPISTVVRNGSKVTVQTWLTAAIRLTRTRPPRTRAPLRNSRSRRTTFCSSILIESTARNHRRTMT